MVSTQYPASLFIRGAIINSYSSSHTISDLPVLEPLQNLLLSNHDIVKSVNAVLDLIPSAHMQFASTILGGRVISHNPFDFILIRRPVLLVEVVCISLGWRVGIGVVKEILDTKEDLFNGDCWFPAFFFVQD